MKKIPSQFAIGFIVIISILIGGIFVALEQRQQVQSEYFQKNSKNKSIVRNIEISKVNNKIDLNKQQKCAHKYFEGEARIMVWIVDKPEEGKIKVHVKRDDIELLPTTKIDSQNENFIATLVDSTPELIKELEISSEKNPVTLDVRGYALACENYPQISIQQASKVFKKS